jgi:hypothetical protein
MILLHHPTPQDISIDILHELFGWELIKDLLIKIPQIPEEEGDLMTFPQWFPDHLDNPILSDIYINEPPSKGFDTDYDNHGDRGDILVLGSYTPMQSPGIIAFYKNNIARYSAGLIRMIHQSGYSLRPEMAFFVIHFVVDDIMNHETFHYYSDYKRRITGAPFDHNKEEGLAVAYSYEVKKRLWPIMRFNSGFSYHHESRFEFLRSPYGRKVYGQINRILMKEHYKFYSLPGYRDWPSYTGFRNWNNHAYEYLKNGLLDTLKSNGVCVDEIFKEVRLFCSSGAAIVVTN